tara:strand:+ start:195 stop:485 length:291 start_codon:yes stop_codon:yes gene_type:complete
MSQKRLKNAKLRRSLHISEAPNWTMVRRKTNAKRMKQNNEREVRMMEQPNTMKDMMAMIDAQVEEQMKLTPPHLKLVVKIRTTKEGVVVDFDRVAR